MNSRSSYFYEDCDHDRNILKKEYAKLIFVGSQSSQKFHQEVKPLKCYGCSIKIQVRQDPTQPISVPNFFHYISLCKF